MALIIRIDVDRPYGKVPFARHVLSRLGSDIYFPRVESFGYLSELKVILEMLNAVRARAYVFFRRCTLPSKSTLELIDAGGHEIGLHLENSRSFECFANEKSMLEKYIGRTITAVSKHGSGKAKYGFHHYAPYEPDNYIHWAKRTRMRLFLGNLEDPSIPPLQSVAELCVYPSAFWLEPAWRDTQKFTTEWLLTHASLSDIVLLIHPDNVLGDPSLCESFKRLLSSLDTRLVE
jgi:hypothetical protein